MTLAVVTGGESGIGAASAVRLERAPPGVAVNSAAPGAGIVIESGLPLTTIAQGA